MVMALTVGYGGCNESLLKILYKINTRLRHTSKLLFYCFACFAREAHVIGAWGFVYHTFCGLQWNTMADEIPVIPSITSFAFASITRRLDILTLIAIHSFIHSSLPPHFSTSPSQDRIGSDLAGHIPHDNVGPAQSGLYTIVAVLCSTKRFLKWTLEYFNGTLFSVD